MEKTTRLITWYIFTNDGHTNEVISRQMPQESTGKAHSFLICFDGVERPLWECDGSFVTKMKENESNPNLHFKIYKREGKYGPIKEVKFIKRPQKKKKKF